MLNEQDRAKLDGIVQKMTANKESDATIQMVVNDFKQKYSQSPAPAPTPAPTQAPETGIVQDIAQGVAKPFLGLISQGRDVATGAGDLATGIKDAVQGKPVVIPQRPNQTEYDYGYLGKVKSFGKATPDAEGAKALERAAGAGAGIASNLVAGGPVKSVGKSILARTLPKALQLAKEGALAGGLYGAGNAAQDGGSATDVLTQGAVGAVTGAVATPVVGTAIPALAKPITTTVDKLTKPLQTHVADVAQNINRALSTQGKKSIGVFLKNPQKQYKAFEIMHDMAPSLKVVDEAGDVVPWNPKETDFNQFAQAFKDAKDQTWEGISGAIKEATGKDLHVDAGPILDFLNKTAGSKFTTSEVRAAAQRLSDEVANMSTPGTNGQIPIAGLTEYNKVLNTKISGVLTGTTDNAVRDLEAGLAKQLSEAADKAVESVTDSRFATLKDNYGALKTIEKDLVRRAQQESRQIDNSLGDFMNRYGTIEIANGFFQAAQGNFGPLAKGVGAKVLGAYSKKLRTPSTYLKKAFTEIDRFKSGEGIQNMAVKGVKAIKDMSKKSPRGMIDFNAEVFPKKKVINIEDVAKKFSSSKSDFLDEKSSNIVKSKTTLPKAVSKLEREAGKYKTVEEFVKAQGKITYRSTSKPFDKNLISERGIFTTPDKNYATNWKYGKGRSVEELIIDKKSNILNKDKIPKEFYSTEDGIKYIKNEEDLIKYAKKNGFDGYENVSNINGKDFEPEIVVFNKNMITTKTQLTNIWDKVNKVVLPKADKYVRDAPTGKFSDKFNLPEKVPEGMQSRLKVLKNAIETSGKPLKDIWNNHKEAFNYLNDTGAFVTEGGIVEKDIPKIIKAIYDVARAHKKAPLPKVSPATKMIQERL